MLKTTSYSLLILSSFALHSMEKEKDTSIFSNLASKVKSIAISIASSFETKTKVAVIVKHPDKKLADILKFTLEKVEKLPDNTTIEVTTEDNKTLLGWPVMDPECKNEEHKFFRAPAGEGKVYIKPGIYILENDSYLNNKYLWHSFSFGAAGSNTYPNHATAHHLQLRKILEVEYTSIFKPHLRAQATGYNLDIIYTCPDTPTENTDCFELDTVNNEIGTNPAIIRNPGFETMQDRIKYFAINNAANIISINNILVLKRS